MHSMAIRRAPANSRAARSSAAASSCSRVSRALSTMTCPTLSAIMEGVSPFSKGILGLMWEKWSA